MANTPNEGCNGFHLYTVVTDGYGNLIAEDHRGLKIAEVSTVRTVDGERDDDPTAEPFIALTRKVWAVLEGEAEPLDPRAKEM